MTGRVAGRGRGTHVTLDHAFAPECTSTAVLSDRKPAESRSMPAGMQVRRMGCRARGTDPGEDGSATSALARARRASVAPFGGKVARFCRRRGRTQEHNRLVIVMKAIAAFVFGLLTSGCGHGADPAKPVKKRCQGQFLISV